jgi:type I restriction enzyme S subunit
MVGGPFGSKLVSRDYVPEGVPVIRGGNLPTDSRFSLEDLVFVTEKKVATDLFGNIAFPGDIVVTQRGTLGQVGLIPDSSPHPRFVVSQSQMKLTVDRSKADPLFVYYALKSPIGQHEIRSRAITAGVPHINLSLFQQIRIPFPLLATQRKIAAILSAYDDLIENNNRRIEVLEEMARRIYREWFVDFRYPGHEEVTLVDSVLGPLPPGWAVVALSSVCERITDGAHASPVTTSVGKPMASVKDMTPRRLALESCRRIGIDDFEVLVRQHCQPRVNDVLIAKDGSYLKHVFVVRDDEEVVILSSIALLRANDSIQPDVLTLCLQQPETKERLKGFVSGVAIPRIVLKDFRVFPIVRPPDSLQAAIVGRVDPPLRLAATLDKLNLALRTARDILLPRLISGEVDVSNLNIAMPEVAA